MAEEPEPTLRLDPRSPPYQKVTVKKMPEALHRELSKRATKIGKLLPEYCRIVIEHAMSNRQQYETRINDGKDLSKIAPGELIIPIRDRKFLEELVEWNPHGARKGSRIAIALLMKHLETRKW